MVPVAAARQGSSRQATVRATVEPSSWDLTPDSVALGALRSTGGGGVAGGGGGDVGASTTGGEAGGAGTAIALL